MSVDRVPKLLESVPLNDGIVVEDEKIAAFRDSQGELKTYSAVCTHLGCTVAWNSLEKSFDCPCHGSRFAACSGNVINGPAIDGLETKQSD
jgi:Rieske Fe-S protein